MTSEDKQRRGATLPLSSGESPFLPSSAEHDLFLCTCQGSYTHKEFRIRAIEIPLYSDWIIIQAPTALSVTNIFSSGTAEISLSSCALYMPTFPLLPPHQKKQSLKQKNGIWEVGHIHLENSGHTGVLHLWLCLNKLLLFYFIFVDYFKIINVILRHMHQN